MMVGIFSYMADITKECERTVRIGIISLVYSVGVPFGMAFSGILLRYLHFIQSDVLTLFRGFSITFIWFFR